VVVLALAGCGGHGLSQADRERMNAEFARIDLSIPNMTLGGQPANQAGLEQLTKKYVATTRKYADGLGDDAVRQRLGDEADQLRPWCLRCSALLEQEREKY